MSSESLPSELNSIKVRGARENNLKNVDVDIPSKKLTLFCGPSGSGKSSLALDVLYAEGQRRYVECFAPKVRAFLERFDKPDVERIEGLPPAVAITAPKSSINSHATVGSRSELYSYFKLLFSSIGTQKCLICGHEIKPYSPESVWQELLASRSGQKKLKAMICFCPHAARTESKTQVDFEETLLKQGYSNVIVCDDNYEMYDLDSPERIPSRVYNYAMLLEKAAVSDSSEYKSLLERLGLYFGASNENEGTLENAVLLPNCDLDRIKRTVEKRFKIQETPRPRFYVVVDRLEVAPRSESRAISSIETAFKMGNSQCWVFLQGAKESKQHLVVDVNDEKWSLVGFSQKRRCTACGIDYPVPEPNLFSCSAPSGACEACGGSGAIDAIDEDLIIPEKDRALAAGAVAPWRSSRRKRKRSARAENDQDKQSEKKPLSQYQRRLIEFVPGAEDELNRLATIESNRQKLQEEQLHMKSVQLETEPPVGSLPLDVPFQDLNHEQRTKLFKGVRNVATGINGFLIELLKEKYKMHIRVFLSKYTKSIPCPLCGGKRCREETLSVQFAGKTTYEFRNLTVNEALDALKSVTLSEDQERRAGAVYNQLCMRLEYLKNVGLGYLTLNRPLNTLSNGELRRVDLTKALGSDLVDMLYVLDEPTTGLHPTEISNLVKTLLDLRDRGNTVVVVDHAPEIIKAADKVVEFEGSGRDGGVVAFEGTPKELVKQEDSFTGRYLVNNGVEIRSRERYVPPHKIRMAGDVEDAPKLITEFLELSGATGRNLKGVDISLPLGTLCVVTGVSGSGKTSLVCDTLYPALCQKVNFGATASLEPLPFGMLGGYERLEEIILVDQTPIGRSLRSNPVTYLRIFDDIRAIYASIKEAKERGYTAGDFSFNIDGGRCTRCRGEGYIQEDMKFMADVYTRCPVCNGKRYKSRILDILDNTLNIADVLDLTAEEALVHFRSRFKEHPKIRKKLLNMIAVGLGYLKLGQPGSTLSGGESQRLKLAQRLSSPGRASVYILDEPSAGLYVSDVKQLVAVFNDLVDSGASLVVVDNSPELLRAADYIVELGPCGGEKGGFIVDAGSPEELVASGKSRAAKLIS